MDLMLNDIRIAFEKHMPEQRKQFLKAKLRKILD